MPPRFEHEHDDEHEDDLVAATPRCASVVNPLRSSRFGFNFRRPKMSMEGAWEEGYFI
jgi:hypothetical protein